jgi:hypothetical protein
LRDEFDISELSRSAQALLGLATVLALREGGYAVELDTVQASLGMLDDEFELALEEAYEAGFAWRFSEGPDDVVALETCWIGDLVQRSIGPTNRPKASDWQALRDEVFSRLFVGTTPHCLYCRSFDVPLVLDHALPLARGGSNHAGNLWPACAPCNTSKGAKTTAEFIAWRKARGL